MDFDLDAKDLLGLKKPLSKLIDVIRKGIGVVYHPRAIRTQADADAYRIRALATARADAKLIEAEGKVRVARTLAAPARPEDLTTTTVEQDGSQPSDTVARAKARVLTKEVEAQLNIEAIVDQAAANLPEDVSDTPVDDGWRRKFFMEAENVCDRDLQVLWGKILAGEVASPGRYSLRTLEVLKQMTKREAELFTLVANIADSAGYIYLPGDHNSVIAFGLTYDSLLALREAGLMHQGDSLFRDFSNMPQGKVGLTLNIAETWVRIDCANLATTNFSILALTQPGRELRQLAATGANEDYLKALAVFMRARGNQAYRGTLTETGPGQGILTFNDPL